MTSVADPEHFHMDPDPDMVPAFRDDTDPDLGSWILAFQYFGKNPNYFITSFHE